MIKSSQFKIDCLESFDTFIDKWEEECLYIMIYIVYI